MNPISIDTIHLRITDYRIGNKTKLRIQPAQIDGETGESLNEKHLYGDTYGAYGYKNFDDGSAIDLKPFIGNLEVKTHFTFGRVLTGQNYNLLDYNGINDTVNIISDRLKDTGIHCDINEAFISRVDLTRNVITDEPVENYFHTLRLCEMSRKFLKDYGVESLQWQDENQYHQFQFYDKILKMKKDEKRNKLLHKTDYSGYPHTLRGEQRLMKAQAVKQHLGFAKLKDLISKDGFRYAQEQYINTLKKNQFKYDVENIEILSQKSMELELCSFRNIYGDGYLPVFLMINGYADILRRCSPDIFFNAIRSVETSNSKTKKQKIWRYRSKLKKVMFYYEQMKSDLFAGKSSMDLYGELKAKFLEAA